MRQSQEECVELIQAEWIIYKCIIDKRFLFCKFMQVDFNLPQRFDITYVDSNSEKKQPIMIHRAVLGSLERFFGVLIEHYAGDFPLWLSPIQARVLPVTDTQVYLASIVLPYKFSFRQFPKLVAIIFDSSNKFHLFTA